MFRRKNEVTYQPKIGTAWGKKLIKFSVILATLTSVASASLFIILGRIIQSYYQHQNPSPTLKTILLVNIVFIAAIWGLNLWISATAALKEEEPIRHDLMEHIIKTGPQKRTQERTGKTVDAVTNGVERVAFYRNTFLGPLFSAAIIPLITVIIIGFGINWWIALWLTISLPAIPLVIRGFQTAFKKVSGKSYDARSELAAKYLDAIQGLTTLRVLRSAKKVETELSKTGEKNRQSIMKLLAGNQLILFVVDSVFSILMITLSAGLALYFFKNHTINLGQAITLILLSTLLLQPLDQIGQFFYVGMGGMASKKAISKLLATPTLPDILAANKNSPKKINLTEVTNILDISKVDFKFDQRIILKNINLQLQPRESVTIVGPSGEGKTTLVNLILGLLEPTSGVIKICGETTNGPFNKNHLVTVVSQSTWLFTGTIAYNLRIAKPKATQKEMWKALDFANLTDEVQRMPEKLNTLVGEKGLSLSGGQAQRIALARAYLADTPLVIFDEPTAHVDLESESYIIKSLQELAKTKTLLTITHSKIIMENSSAIYELKNSHLVKIK